MCHLGIIHDYNTYKTLYTFYYEKFINVFLIFGTEVNI